MSTAVAGSTATLLRELAPQVLAKLARRHRDFAAAEDALQQALLAAARQWPDTGVPQQPRAWLLRVASRRLADHVRAELARTRREGFVFDAGPVTAPAPDDDAEVAADDTLALVLMCCHPALTRTSAIALTLRAVAGLTTGEIARAFLVPEATMAQRISRAKQTIASSGIGFELPGPHELDARLDAALHVLYLVFNEGYASGGAHLMRVDLAREAIRLARMLLTLRPTHGELLGLLALMLLTDARRDARTGARGELVALDEQDRSLWDRAAIAEGIALVTEALSRRRFGPYAIQAAIAALHDEAPSTAQTDWPQILALYGALEAMGDNPMVALNRAVALAMVRGPAAGLAALDALADEPRLAGGHRLDAVRGHLLEMAGDRAAALVHYRAAAACTTSVPERDYLIARAARLEQCPG